MSRAVGGTPNNQPALIDLQANARWKGRRDIEMVPAGTCPDCGQELHPDSTAQLPLIRHGGYGEVQENTLVSCSCGYARHHTRTSENPRTPADSYGLDGR